VRVCLAPGRLFTPRPTRLWRLVLAVALSVALWPAGPAAAQTPPAAAAGTQPAAPEPLGRASPWGTVTGFLRAARRDDLARAAEYLEAAPRRGGTEALAGQLFTVLNLGLTVDIDRLSRSPDGDLDDGLPASRERVGAVELRSGTIDILLERFDRPGQNPIWLFTADTLLQVPAAAEELSEFSPEAYLPRALVEITFLSQPLYRWILAPLLLALAWILGSLLARAAIPLLRPVLRRLTGEHGDSFAALAPPLRLILVGVAIRVFTTLSTSLQGRQFWTRVAAVIVVIGVAWLAIRLSSIVSALVTRRLTLRRMFGRIAVVGLVGRLFRLFVVVVAALALLYRAGVDLTAILTGLGIGGLGLALGAQKTLENLLGGIMIIGDEPIRVGDFCRAGDQMGTVEDIGIRSTRIRTLARTVVAVPNGELATMNVENFAQRDKFWLHHTLGVRYETTPDQMRSLLAGVRAMLQAHPAVEHDGARVRFVSFGSSSLDLEIFAYVYAGDVAAFLEIQEGILLRVMEIVVESGTAIAFPSQTTYLAWDNQADAERKAAVEGMVKQRDEGQDA
jgi:MscS family membrane protein